MAKDTPEYDITQHHNVLHVTLKGHWDLAADKKYLDDLAAHFNQVNDAPWALVVDMRLWRLKTPQDNLFQQKTANVHLDRTNQVAECWIVNAPDQASEIRTFVESVPGLRFKRVLREQDASDWLGLLKFQSKPA